MTEQHKGFQSCAAQSQFASYLSLPREQVQDILKSSPEIFGPLLDFTYARQKEMAETVGDCLKKGDHQGANLFLGEVEKTADFIEFMMNTL